MKQHNFFFKRVLFLCMGSLMLLNACNDDTSSHAVPIGTGTGTLIFNANGEGFVADGFRSEDDWHIQFDHVYVNIYGPTAFQGEVETNARHAGHPHAEIPDGTAHVSLTGEYFVDLKRNSGPDIVEVGRVINAPVGNYNFLNFTLKNITADSAPTLVVNDDDNSVAPDVYEGYCLVLIGTADDDGPGGNDPIGFTIKFNQEMAFNNCGILALEDNYSVVETNGTGDVQMTFHFDHIFGDGEEVWEEDTDYGNAGDPTGPDCVDPEYMNFWGIGFDPFRLVGDASYGGSFDIDQEDMKTDTPTPIMPNSVHAQLYNSLKTLGHYGEGHCYCGEVTE